MRVKVEILAPDNPTVLCIIPGLAAEIGLNESLVLRQLAFWIKTSDNFREGNWWTYQSLRDMKDKAFPFWAVNTINRAIKNLEKSGLIRSTDEYNARKSDKTRWFALIPGAIQKLKSVETRTIMPELKAVPKRNSKTKNNPKSSNNEGAKAVPKWNKLFQNGTGLFQNGTTLPETTTETTTEKREKQLQQAAPATPEPNATSTPPKNDDGGGGSTNPDEVKPIQEQDNDLGRASKAYLDNIGLATPMILDKLKDAVGEWGADKFIEAVEISVENNVRKWSYIDGILSKWRANGYEPRKKKSSAPKSDGEQYTDEERAILEAHDYDMYYLYEFRKQKKGAA